ncbi:MAG: VOC family protein [Rubellimicrobium sp.]|nr:VOC family protein [Rubellimicrobium sp.]
MEPSATSLPAATRLGPVTLRVADAEAALMVWRDIAGLSVLARREDLISLGAGGRTLIELTGGAGPATAGPVVGLFHVALHVTSRAALGGVLARIRASGRRHSGQDHTVSDSLYISDDDGNGIEFAFDTPDRGRIEAADGSIRAIRSDGRILSVIEPLDLDALAAETSEDRADRHALPADSFIGHIHFRTNDRARAHDFSARTLGFRPHGNAPAFSFCDVGTERRRHMVAFNSWGGENLPAASPDAPGVARFVILVPDAAALRDAGLRLRAAGHRAEQWPDGIRFADPDANPILLTDAAG